MKLKHLLMKTLFVAVGLCVGQSVWADDVASYDFNDQTTPFTIYDAARLSVTYPEYVEDGGDRYAKYNCGNYNKVAFAYYNFATNVLNAATVTISFDFNVQSQAGHALISIADADVHTRGNGGFSEKSNTGYGSNGVIFNLGCYRAGGNNKFGINSTQNNLAGLDAWCHASITVNNVNRTVDYTITKGGSTLTSGSGVSFLSNNAGRCSQIDIYIGNNGTNMNVSIDNLVITKTVSDVSHNYTINAVAGGSTIKTNMKSGSATEGAAYTFSGLPYVVEKDGNFYVLDDANVTNNGVTFTMLNADQTKTVNYTLDESIVYFKEAESFAGSNASSPENRASGGAYTSYFRNNTSNAVTTLNKGVYRVETYIWARNDKEINLYKTSKDNENILASLTGSGSRSKIFLIDANSTATVLGCVNNSCCFDYILIRKLYDVTDPNKIVGKVDYSTPANGANSSDYTMKPGDTKVFTFQNHGQDDGKNWRIVVKQGETWKANVCADSWDYTAGAATKVSYQVSKDGGGTKVAQDWTEYQADMADARVVATLTYGTDGKLAITTTSTGAANGYIYYVDQDVTGLSGDVTVNLSVNNSWLEILSVEQTAVPATIGATGYTTFSSAYALELSGMTASEGDVTAYYASSVGGSSVVMTSTEADVEAGTGLLLKGTAGATVTIPVAATGSELSGNLLKGCIVETPDVSGADKYVLVNNSGNAEFQNLGTTPATIPAGKAYLDATGTGARSLTISFDDEDVTGVNEVRSQKENVRSEWFDLQGRKVAQPTKGLYIVNGKKVVIK